MVRPFEDHVIYRVDNMFLYPHPIYISYASLKLHNESAQMPNIKKSQYSSLKLQYVFPRQLDLYQNNQVNNTDTKKIALLKLNDVSVLDFPFTTVPLKLKVAATVYPNQCQKESEYSFVFSGSDLWRYESPTWITATIFHINCSLKYRQPHDVLYLPYNKIQKLCSFLDSNELNKTLHIIPPVYLYEDEAFNKWNTLTFILHTKLGHRSQIGTFTSSIISNELCRNKLVVGYKLYWYSQFFWRSYPMKCLKLTSKQIINTCFLNREGRYKILLRLEKSNLASFSFNSVFLKSINGNISYFWKEFLLEERENHSQYTIYLSKYTYSWNEAVILCSANNSHLPIFKNKQHLQEFIFHIFLKYDFQILKMFVGIKQKVR